MQMCTVCLDSADNVRGRTVRYPLPIRGFLMWTPRRFYWISHSPRWQTCVAATLLEGHTADLPPAGSDIKLIAASRQDATLTTVCVWVQSGL